MGLLSTILTPSPRSRQTLVLIQSTLATPTWLHLTRSIIGANPTNATIVCVCLLHSPATMLAEEFGLPAEGSIRIVDWTERIPGYAVGDEVEDADRDGLVKEVSKAINDAPDGPVLLALDSPDTLCEDVESPSKAYVILKTWHTAILKRPSPSRLVLSLSSRSSLLPLLVPPAFASSIAHLTLHPTSLLSHLATEYLTLPPPYCPATKFWPIFTGLATRGEGERLVWGTDGTGWNAESVVEVIVRNASGKRAVERSLEGWRKSGVCKLEELKELKDIWSRNSTSHQPSATLDPTHNLPFNLSLTEAQQHSRAQVPLPYAHEGQTKDNFGTGGEIYYDPDSADDIDSDDPDEDLDI